jgi:hypothetical protein
MQLAGGLIHIYARWQLLQKNGVSHVTLWLEGKKVVVFLPSIASAKNPKHSLLQQNLRFFEEFGLNIRQLCL